VEVERGSPVIVLRCAGRIVKGDGADALLRAVTSEPGSHIVIDLNEVNAIDAAGLGVLAQLELWAREGNRTIRWLNPSPNVRAALEVTRLGSVLQLEPERQSRRTAA
jgi:anti-anti-sigma factor